MKSNWQLKKIGEICKVIAGQSPEGKFYNKIGNGLPFYQGKKEFGEKYIGAPTTWTTKITKEAKEGDILMSVRAPVGPINFATEKICIGRGLAAIRADATIDKEFLYYFFLGYERYLTGNEGAVFNSIKKSQIENIEIELPSLLEQKRIVKMLDEAFEKTAMAKENVEKNFQNTKEFFDSYLKEIFLNQDEGWEEKTLKEIATIKGGKRVPRGYKLKFEKTDHPYISVIDFNDNGGVDMNNIKYIDDDTFAKIRKYTISSKDLYISIVGTIGKTGIVPKDLDGANLTENAAKLIFVDGVDAKFIYYFTKSPDFMIQAGLNTRTTAMPKLALTRLSTIHLRIPQDVRVQQRITSRLDILSATIQKLRKTYHKKFDNFEKLNKSILKQAFTQVL